MEWFVEKNKTLNHVTDPKVLAGRVPWLSDSMDAVSDLREQNRQTGTQGSMFGGGWKHIASVCGPVLAVAELLDPEFLNGNNKRNLYNWLDTHPAYLTYDRRAAMAKKTMWGWRPEEGTNGD